MTSRSLVSRALYPVFLLVAAALPACDDSGGGDSIQQTEFPSLQIEPERLVFPAIEQGQSSVRTLSIRNAGGGALRVEALRFSNTIDTAEFSWAFAGGGSDAGADGLPAVVNGGEQVQVDVTYTPRNAGLDEGFLLVTTNLSADPVRVPIDTLEAAGELFVTPDRVVFPGVPGGEMETRQVTVTNAGSVPVQLTNIVIESETTEDFGLTGYTLAIGDAEAQSFDPADGWPELATGDQFVIDVTYTPTGRNSDEGVLVINTADAQYERIERELRGDEPTPTIEVSPDRCDFGAVELGEESETCEVFIRNAGTAPLIISALEFGLAAPGTNDQFRLTADDPEIQLGPDDVTTFTVVYAPMAEGRHETGVAITSNDPERNLLVVPITGRVPQPCISVVPESLSFGAVALGVESARKPLQVINCGDLDLNLNEIRIDGGDGNYSWARADGGQNIADPIPPRGLLALDVWYENQNLAEGDRMEANLVVENDTLDTPTVEVPLVVAGGGAPRCELRWVPNRVEFGLVSRGTCRTREAQIVNVGTGPCDLQSITIPQIPLPIPGLQNPFSVAQGLPPGPLAPGSFNPVTLQVCPDVYGPVLAQVQATYRDPFMMMDTVITADLQAVAGDANIAVIPGELDFGRVTAGECASREERVTAYNTGLIELCISGIRLEGDCNEFFVVERPVANADGCIVVSRNTPAEVVLVYEPGDIGPDQCTLIFESDAADFPELRVPLQGEGAQTSEQVDEFIQTSGRDVDILFVIDNSGSMSEEQENLRRNFSNFVSAADRFNNNYQIGVVTTDMVDEGESGRLQGNPRIMRRAGNIANQFSDAADVGSGGSADEKGLEAAQRALSNPLSFDTGVNCGGDADCVAPDTCVEGVCGGHNRGFVRDTAALEVIFVSDEDDSSPGTLNFYVDFLKNIKGFRNDSLFHAHSIVGAENGRASGCSSDDGDAVAGRRYVEVSSRTNGEVFSICDDNFGPRLQVLGQRAFDLAIQFFLTRPALRDTIEVSVDGAPSNGWVYDEDSNSIVFENGDPPAAGATVRVEYEAECFQRRN